MPKYSRDQDKITGKIIINAMLTNESPLLIGSGTNDGVDIEVMRLPDGRPYIPASSIAGCLKSFLDGSVGFFWGRTGRNEENPLQSHIRFDDLISEVSNPTDITVRDGVKINHHTGTAEDGKKYDYEILEPGMQFPFRAEITVRQSMEIGNILDHVGRIKVALESEHFRLGANTNTGFGKLSCDDFNAYYFNFPIDSEAWFDYINTGYISINPKAVEVKDFANQHPSFSIQATFSLKSSLMIGAYGVKGDEPDKTMLRSRDKFVLPGKSIRGAIRHRARKIWKLWEQSDEGFYTLFGNVDENTKEQNQIRSRLRIDEYKFEDDEVKPMVQDRIKIDRFTGGTIDSALFNSEPIWKTGEERIQLQLSILTNATPIEKKLLLMLLKDLWLEDLAIGGEKNVGRGILTGLEATIREEGKIITKFKRVVSSSKKPKFCTGEFSHINFNT